MPRLVALDLRGGPRFVDALQRVWDAGDAVFPVDQRLRTTVKTGLFGELGVSAVVDQAGLHHELGGGWPTEPGDAVVVVTSGSTGAPKGVVLTHDSVAASATATSRRLGVSSNDHWLACLPLSHVGGLAVVIRSLLTSTQLTVLPDFDADAVNSSNATLVSLVPTTLRRVESSRFRTIVLGGSRPPAERPPNVVTTYGLTESGSGVVYDGRPLDGVEVRLVAGELYLRCPMLLRAYRDGTDPRVEGGWFPTGDLGEIADDGEVLVKGRRGDLIITGGENVWPESVEAVLRDVAGVHDVAVVGTPDEEWGEIITALVVPVDRSSPVGLDVLRAAAKARLPAYAAPRRVVCVTELPRTPLGKLQRSRLRPTSE